MTILPPRSEPKSQRKTPVAKNVDHQARLASSSPKPSKALGPKGTQSLPKAFGHPTSRRSQRASKKGRDQEPGVFLVYSRAVVLDYLRLCPTAVQGVYGEPVTTHRDGELCELARAAGHTLKPHAALGEEATHIGPQEIVAQVRVEAGSEADLLWEEGEQPSLLVAIDHVTDPRNLGSIVRTAAFFGIPQVIAPKNRQVGLTGASVATAQGGFATTQLVQVTNLARTLARLKEAGYWVIGTALSGQTLASIAQAGYPYQVLVLGSEDKGLSPVVLKSCDLLAHIQGAPRRVQSLNVAVAAGIGLAALSSERPVELSPPEKALVSKQS